MRVQRHRWNLFTRAYRTLATACVLTLALTTFFAAPAQAAVSWDGGPADGTQSPYWFYTAGWNNDAAEVVPPVYSPEEEAPFTYSASSSSDALINGTGTWDEGEGVVYDPANDPYFAATSALAYWTELDVLPYAPQTIWRLYMGRYPKETVDPTDSKLTIKSGNLTTNANLGLAHWQIGRTSGTANEPANATIVQEGGVVTQNAGDLDLGSVDANEASGGVGYFGNGTYDYRGGTLVQGFDASPTSARVRLSAGGSAGTGGIGTFIMRNPVSEAGGYVRVEDFQVAAHGGQNGIEPDAIDQGIGIVEFHYKNGGTRPIQVTNNLSLANGPDAGADEGVRSSRLRLVLDEAPTVVQVGETFVPINLGLFDVDSDLDGVGNITGPTAGGVSDYGITFSNADAPDPNASSAVYDNATDAINLPDDGDILTATFGLSTYRWRIYYNGKITWQGDDQDPPGLSHGPGYDASIVESITGPGTGLDLVLIGLDSVIVEEGLDGDYNENDVIDAADYCVWRDAFEASSTELPNDPTPGSVTESDYTYWKAHFGETLPPGSGSLLAAAAVPEPSTVVLMIFGAVLLVGRGWAPRR